MADQNKFGQLPNVAPGAGGLRCEEWEAFLVDALDGVLPVADTAAFNAHSASCAGCADLLAHARQGQEWLEYLHPEPDVPAGLVGKILEKTAGAGAVPIPVVAVARGAGAVAAAVPLRRSFQETRLMMTVAMAFFSIALTLNLAGVRFSSLRMADLRPSALSDTLSRQLSLTWGQVVHYYDNLRFVYQLESRMRELRRDLETAPSGQQPQTQKKAEPPKQGGNGRDGSLNSPPDPSPVLAAEPAQNSPLSTQTDRIQQSTEVRVSEATGSPISLDQHGAGPRRYFVSAGNDGRSLA